MRGGTMAIEAIDWQRTGKKWSVLTEKEKAEVMRVIDEYDFVSMVLKYKGALMPEDLVRELTRQNDMNRETIVVSLSLEFPISVC
jgi:hypothetical protein